MEVGLKKHNPGAEPFHALDYGTTKKDGVSIRAYFAIIAMQGLVQRQQDKKYSTFNETARDALKCADALIEQLYPPPEVRAVGPVDQERGVCAHDGEILFQNGTFQCMKCKNAVPASLVVGRTKK